MDYLEELVENTDLSINRPMRDVVYESLKGIIIEGKIPVGARIVEKEFANRLNISRTPIREALRKLEMEELVEYIPRTGVVVKRISQDDVKEIYKIRKCLELLAVENTMKNITEKEIQEIEKILELTEEKNKAGEIEQVFKLFTEFNERIYEASGMPKLKSMINNLNEYLKRFRRISISDFERRVQAVEEHKLILNSIINKDINKARRVIYTHLDKSLDIVIQYFDDYIEN